MFLVNCNTYTCTIYFLAQHIYLHTQTIITEIRKALQQREDRPRVRDQLPQYGDEDESPAIFSGQEEEEEVRACKFSVLLSLEEKVLNN